MSRLPLRLRRILRSPGLRAALLYGGPTLAILALAVLPVILGRETLILRDVLQTHLMLKAPQAEAIRAGVLPLLDAYRGGGQPLLGNPNAVPFYPDNLLYAVAPVLWALNAHFWIHWLLAPVGMFLLARAWGLGRSGAWAAGVCYATSGFFMSQLNLYNLVAGAALVPALVAAVLRATEEAAPRRRAWAAAAGLLWALVLLSGDPTMAVAGALVAASAVAVRSPHALLRGRSIGPLVLGIALGTLVALPQIVEFLRILPASYRGHQGFSEWRLTVAAWRPVHALEWLVPTAFGRFDLRGHGGFWGGSLFGGNLPFFLSLYPGALAAALVLASGLPRKRRELWAWGALAAGLLLAAGGSHPLGRWLFELPGAQVFRYPVKLSVIAAVAAALLCGVGWQRVFGRGAGDGEPPTPPRPARLGWALGAVATLLVLTLAAVVARPDLLERWTFAVGPEGWTAALAASERARWIATLATVLVLVAALAAALALGRRRPALAAVLLLALHSAGQVHLLRGLIVTDELAHYAEPPPLLDRIPEGARVAHAGFMKLFGEGPTELPAPDHRLSWSARQGFDSLIPAAGVLHGGLRYELNRSPEGLSSFLSRAAHDAVAVTPWDRQRLLALSRWGVEYVIAPRPLTAVPAALAEESVAAGAVEPVYLYRLLRPAPEIALADLPLRVPHLNAAWDLFRSPGFDPRRHVVLPPAADEAGDDRVPALPEIEGPSEARLRVLRRGSESLEVEVTSAAGAVLVVQRSILPVWRATVDGRPVAIEPANLYRIGVPVSAGRHRVRLWVDRAPLRLSLAGSAAGLLALIALAVLPRMHRRPAPARAREETR